MVATLAFDPDAGTATCELWLPIEPVKGGLLDQHEQLGMS